MQRRRLIKTFLQYSGALASFTLLPHCHQDHKKVEGKKEDDDHPSPLSTSTSAPQPWVLKAQRFDDDFPDDLYLSPETQYLVKTILLKMERLQNWYGYGYFNILGFEPMIQLSRWESKVPTFSKEEFAFFEDIFFKDARDYGFFGDKVIAKLTFEVPQNEIIKIPHSGHYLFKGESLRTYEQLKKDVGPSLILTSGIRGISKQFLLYFRKILDVNGNLSRAARSLAPPGYSFHGCGDFDVGKSGLGELNFTTKFSETSEFQKLRELGYIGLRYYPNNPFGVRYEPWHIEGLKRT